MNLIGYCGFIILFLSGVKWYTENVDIRIFRWMCSGIVRIWMKESCSICRHYSQWDDITLARAVDIFIMLIQIILMFSSKH